MGYFSSGIFQVYLRSISSISLVYLRKILSICMEYLRCIIGKYQICLKGILSCSANFLYVKELFLLSLETYCQTPVLGLGLGVDFTFSNKKKKKNPHLNFLRRNSTMGMKLSIQTLLTKIRSWDNCHGDMCTCKFCPGDNCPYSEYFLLSKLHGQGLT